MINPMADYKTTFNLSDYGVIPDNGKDVFEVVRKASKIIGCDIKVVFPKGTYSFRDEKWLSDFRQLMEGQLSPDTRWGAEGIPYNTAMVFEGLSNVQIDGQGSTFIFDGLVQPFEFINCKNILLKNFVIDWGRPPFTEGVISDIKNCEVEVNILPEYDLKGEEPVWSFHDFIQEERRFGKVCPFREMSSIEKLDDTKVRFGYKDAALLKKGTSILIRHIGNYRPAIHIRECSNVRFEDVTIHSCPGMGVIGFRSEDIFFRNFKVCPSAGRAMSTNTDATHFISCKGTISFEDCYFQGMGDDAANVHGFYYSIREVVDGKTVKAFIDAEYGIQNQLMDFPDEGDKVEFIKRGTLLPYAIGKVKRVKVEDKMQSLLLEFMEPIPQDFDLSDVIANTTRVARFEFKASTVRSIRARGVLVQTRDVTIENCKFIDCTGTAIHVNTAAYWRESLGTRNVTIKNNSFSGCGYGPGTYHNASAVSVQTECEEAVIGVHKGVAIVDNDIDGAMNTGIYISCIDGGFVSGNRFKHCCNTVHVEYSNNIEVRKNEVV